ncbi:uncharacterized protein LOC116920669 [Daphnia magna]|uniref:uncharacterized protein LOC116920669 n=1 Tax=Daphnia magna TaxID=35525 RepID=UPI001E1BBA7A|nr:uncharacterized protein LOC116920669 [Daphnia magna]
MSRALLLNPSNDEVFLPLRSIYIGGEKADEALDYARQPRSASDPAKKQFFTMFFPKERATAEEKARKYALAYLSKHQIQLPAKNAPSSDPILKPKNVRNLCPASLSSLFKRFPLLSDHCNVVEAEKEWRSHVNMPIDYFEIDSSQSTFEFYNMDVEFYWNRVFAAKPPSTEPQFPNLKVCISLLLSLPFSNASAERFFSSMKLTKTPVRNALHDKSVSALLKANNWLKNEGTTAGKVEIPDNLINLAKKVITNAAIQDSQSD